MNKRARPSLLRVHVWITRKTNFFPPCSISKARSKSHRTWEEPLGCGIATQFPGLCFISNPNFPVTKLHNHPQSQLSFTLVEQAKYYSSYNNHQGAEIRSKPITLGLIGLGKYWLTTVLPGWIFQASHNTTCTLDHSAMFTAMVFPDMVLAKTFAGHRAICVEAQHLPNIWPCSQPCGAAQRDKAAGMTRATAEQNQVWFQSLQWEFPQRE